MRGLCSEPRRKRGCNQLQVSFFRARLQGEKRLLHRLGMGPSSLQRQPSLQASSLSSGLGVQGSLRLTSKPQTLEVRSLSPISLKLWVSGLLGVGGFRDG